MSGPPATRPCEGHLAELVDYIDGDLAPPALEALEAHIEACTCCSALERELRERIGLVKQAGRPEVPGDVRARARARVQALLAEARRAR
ncbi:MAG: hypothetical protein HOP14_04440 [Acidobacteria bacterium]|nr:hypothetical protein [Acidobacteriota bacterium]